MTEMVEFLIPDISVWQGTFNFDTFESTGGDAIYFRASNNRTTDTQFPRNKAEAIARRVRGLLWGAYHYFVPQYDPRAQARYFANLIGHYEGDKYVFECQLIPILDVEYKPSTMTPLQAMDAVRIFCQEFYVVTGVWVMIYTRKTWWDVNIARSQHFLQHKLMVAHYNSYITDPWIPLDWSENGKTWTMWQYSADGNGRGAEFGAQSNSIDLSRYYGGRAQFKLDYADFFDQPSTELEDRVQDLEEQVALLSDAVASLISENAAQTNWLRDLSEEIANLKDRVTVLEGDVVTPPPATVTLRVTDSPKANARWQTGVKATGKPIWEIYPSDSSETSSRIQYTTDTILYAEPNLVDGEGGKCWKLVGVTAPTSNQFGNALYVREFDVVRIA